MVPNKSDILILLPAYNEAEVIATVIKNIQDSGYENICVINDGSSDDTATIAMNQQVIVLEHLINRGAGAAIQTGIVYARETAYKYVMCMDSDGQHAPSDIDNLILHIEQTGADIVIGNRFISGDNNIPRSRKIYNKIANNLTNLFCKGTYTDTQSGFRLLNRNAVEKLNLRSDDFGFCSEMIILSEKLNLKVTQCPITVLYTPYSMAKGQNFLTGIKTARSILWQIIFG